MSHFTDVFIKLFTLLVLQMTALAILVFPLPLVLRKKAFMIYQRAYDSKELRTVGVVTTVLIGLQFSDSLRSSWKWHREYTQNHSMVTSADLLARRFYSQRNLYISGAILFLTLAIPTVFSIVRRLIKYEELKRKANDPKAVEERVEQLTKQLASKDLDLKTLQKQKSGLETSYNKLADQLNEKEGVLSDKKKD